MKAIITLTAGLMIVSATFAQSSRRTEVKENNNKTTNTGKSEVVSPERRTATPGSNDSRTVSTSNRRGNDNSTVEKKPEVNTSSPQTPPSNTDRSSVTNRRTPSEQPKTTSGNISQKPSTRVYDSNRREPVANHNQGMVQEHRNRTVEPRHHEVVHKSYRPVPIEVRRVKYPYRAPVRAEIIWTVDLSRRFEVFYPAYRPYRYHVGMRLNSISAYDAFDFVGEIARVYGRVAETYYSFDTDEYFLYIGDYYPYQDFSVIIPGREARDFSRRPERFFDNENIAVTGLITRFEGKPEMVIKESSQIDVY